MIYQTTGLLGRGDGQGEGVCLKEGRGQLLTEKKLAREVNVLMRSLFKRQYIQRWFSRDGFP